MKTITKKELMKEIKRYAIKLTALFVANILISIAVGISTSVMLGIIVFSVGLMLTCWIIDEDWVFLNSIVTEEEL